MIEAIDIEAAERILEITAQAEGLDAQHKRVDINPEALNRFVEFHTKRMRTHIPDLDPRVEAGFNTYFRHALMVGVLTGRGSNPLAEPTPTTGHVIHTDDPEENKP